MYLRDKRGRVEEIIGEDHQWTPRMTLETPFLPIQENWEFTRTFILTIWFTS
jgi:hypothetical protein